MGSNCGFLLLFLSVVSSQRDPSGYVITHHHIREAIRNMQKSIINLEDKLQRHEMRTTATEEQLMRNVKKLDASQSSWDQNLENIGRNVASIESKVTVIQGMVQEIKEGQNSNSQKIDFMQESLLNSMKEEEKHFTAQEEFLTRINGKIDAFADKTKQYFAAVISLAKQNEMKIEQQKSLLESAVSKDSGEDEILFTKLATFEPLLEKLSNEVEQFLSNMNFSLWYQHNGLSFVQMDTVPSAKDIQNIAKDYEAAISGMVHRLEQLEEAISRKLDEKEKKNSYNDAQFPFAEELETKISSIKSDLVSAVAASEENSKGCLLRLKDDWNSTSLQFLSKLADLDASLNGLREISNFRFKELSDELHSLSNVESVVLETADVILSTKRRVEYGIQQILLEIGDAVRISTSDLNAAITDGINNATANILGKQADAFDEMTSNLGGNIEQVWRQIGVIYAQLTQSRDLLANVENQTKVYVNSSLNKVGHMGGQVGQVLDRMAQVEDNLNFLLGRLSLVASEFNVMKYSVGNELNSMRKKIASAQVNLKEDKSGNGPFATKSTT